MARRIAFVVAEIDPATEFRVRGRLPERDVCSVKMDALDVKCNAVTRQ